MEILGVCVASAEEHSGEYTQCDGCSKRNETGLSWRWEGTALADHNIIG